MEKETVLIIREVSGSSLTIIAFVLFLVLKLTGAITWPWVWVTCPLWIGVALVLSVVLFVLICILVITACAGVASALAGRK